VDAYVSADSRGPVTRNEARSLIVFQSAGSFLLFVAAHFSSSMLVRSVDLVAATIIGIWVALRVFRQWKIENDGGGPIFPWMFYALAIALVYQVVDGADCYVHAVYGGKITLEAALEGFHFSVQTVTTVGYGDWPIAGQAISKENLLSLRAYSTSLMAVGATLFTVVLGMTTTWLLQSR
jgi:hypothetical protein